MTASDQPGTADEWPLLRALRESGSAVEAEALPFDVDDAVTRLRREGENLGLLTSGSSLEDDLINTGRHLEGCAPLFDIDAGANAVKNAGHVLGLLGGQDASNASRRRPARRWLRSLRDWSGRMRRYHEGRRVEHLDGHAGQRSQAGVVQFVPVLNTEERAREMADAVARLSEVSVDEATSPLDDLINAQRILWGSRLRQQHRAFLPEAELQLAQAKAIVSQYALLHAFDHARLRDAEAGFLALSDSASSPAADSAFGAAVAARHEAVADRPTRLPKADKLSGRPQGLAAPKLNRDETGRPHSALLHTLAMLIAAVLNFYAFDQVVGPVLPEQPNWIVYLVSAGMTSVALYIVHMSGVLLRELKAETTAARRIPGRVGTGASVILCTGVWGTLGLLAYWARLSVPSIGTPVIGGGTHQSAMIFLGLYLATGIVAGLGAYFTYNPFRHRYAKAIRAYRKAAEQAAASTYQLNWAQAGYDRQLTAIRAAEEVLKIAIELNRAFSEQLKQSTRVQLVGLARDPAATDAVFGEDNQSSWTGAPVVDRGQGTE